MVSHTPAPAGGCWFCETDAQHSWGFSFELDTYFHWACAEAEGVADAPDPVLEFESRRFSG